MGFSEFMDSTTKSAGDKTMGIVLMIVNIVIPGLGTMINSFQGGFDAKTFVTGLVFLLVAWLIIGWILSIIWGIKIYEKSSGSKVLG